MTLQEKVANVLIMQGHKEIKGKSKKYRVFESENHKQTGYFYFVGKRGAPRIGRHIGSSHSIGKELT